MTGIVLSRMHTPTYAHPSFEHLSIPVCVQVHLKNDDPSLTGLILDEIWERNQILCAQPDGDDASDEK